MHLLNERDARELIETARNLEISAINRLIELGTHDENGRNILDSTIFKRAAQVGRIDIIDALIAAGANVNFTDTDGKTALMVAFENNHLNVVNALRRAGTHISREN